MLPANRNGTLREGILLPLLSKCSASSQSGRPSTWPVQMLRSRSLSMAHVKPAMTLQLKMKVLQALQGRPDCVRCCPISLYLKSSSVFQRPSVQRLIPVFKLKLPLSGETDVNPSYRQRRRRGSNTWGRSFARSEGTCKEAEQRRTPSSSRVSTKFPTSVTQVTSPDTPPSSMSCLML